MFTHGWSRVRSYGATRPEALSCSSLSWAQAGQPILRGISLEVEAGEHLAIMGASGSGKSSLLYCLAGLQPPSRGVVLWAGTDLYRLTARRRANLRRSEVAFIFQTYNLIPYLSVRDNVELQLRMRGVRVDERRVLSLLDRVGISHLRRARAGSLSGGEQQRVAIARAVLAGGHWVFADEPTGALDTVTAGQVREVLSEVPGARKSLIVVTHDPVTASAADRVVYLDSGQISAVGVGESPERISERLLELTKEAGHGI